MKVTKIVRGPEVEQLTRDGWHLVYHIDTAQRFAHQGEAFRNPYSPPYSAPTEVKGHVGIVTDPLFALEKEQEILDREAQLEGRISNAEVKFSEMRDETAKLAKQLSDTQGALAVEKGKVHDRDNEIIRLKQKHVDAVELNRRLEGDLAKVKNEIGEARWREIFK